ncbi:phosphate ABC transporter permease subunit PstC [Kiritimatiellaeota bacterium B1221]|nr:phosphate ABC transporter permease subunit PstC [Kiritimatiellaeota bacterium B1221]
MAEKLSQSSFTAESIQKKSGGFLGVDKSTLIKGLFGGNALVAIIVLALITFFLFREGVEFFPQYQHDMSLYRKSGQELAGLLKAEMDEYNELQKELEAVQVVLATETLEEIEGKEWPDENAKWAAYGEKTAAFQNYAESIRSASGPLKDVVEKVRDHTREMKEVVVVQETRKQITGIDLSTLMDEEEAEKLLLGSRQQVKDLMPEIVEAHKAFRENLTLVLASPPKVETEGGKEGLEDFQKEAEKFLEKIPGFERKLEKYDAEKPFTIWKALGGFLMGTEWITASSWQDYYGIWPLLSGSLMVTGVALFFAIPMGVFAAIYVNQIANSKEQNFIKPFIEFISAIPSVVIGFFGVVVFGELIRVWSQAGLEPPDIPVIGSVLGFFSNILNGIALRLDFFPISERLNAFTAGGLLALMAVPTIFTLAEDAMNNVPKAFTEASEAMGATRWQTIWRIQIPTALSGIISAILLGLGRVIGETMVVLLCAGNRIAVPEFKGAGTVFEPVHTMTGIIAQEMGEVVPESIHYRALFCVGIVLFFLSLLINYVAQIIVRRYQIANG